MRLGKAQAGECVGYRRSPYASAIFKQGYRLDMALGSTGALALLSTFTIFDCRRRLATPKPLRLSKPEQAQFAFGLIGALDAVRQCQSNKFVGIALTFHYLCRLFVSPAGCVPAGEAFLMV